MKVGDLVRNVYTGEVGLITEEYDEEYIIVDNLWTIPKEHLEVVNEDR